MELMVDGHPVFAAGGGRAFDPDLPCILFIHGAGNDHSVWQMPARYFAYHGRSVLAVDLPGHGRSGGAPLGTIEEMGEWIWRLADSIPAETVALAGHSMGGMIALAAAAAQSGRVTALAALGVATRIDVHPELLAAARRDDHLAIDLITSWGFSTQSQVGGNRVPGLWMTGGGARLLERIPDGVLGSDLAACEAFDGAMALAKRITCPTLILLGDRDLMMPQRGGHELAAEFKDVRTIVLNGCGHMMLSERPNETLDALREVL